MTSLAEAGKNENVAARGNAAETVTNGHLSVNHSIQDVLNHPAFAGHGRLILPWDDRPYDEDMRLSNIGSLLPYHSHVSPDVVVDALNHMIDDVNSLISIPRRRSGRNHPKNIPGCSSSVERSERRLQLSPRVAGFPTWLPSP